MSKKFYVVSVIVLIFIVVSFVSAIAEDESGEEKVDKSICLACHGSFDDIAAATADYKAPSGETVSPHRYVPHKQNAENSAQSEEPEIPQCVECHVPHPIPPESKDQVIIPKKIDWCYASCHHMNDLQPCGNCH